MVVPLKESKERVRNDLKVSRTVFKSCLEGRSMMNSEHSVHYNSLNLLKF